jgi:hypothetical protein
MLSRSDEKQLALVLHRYTAIDPRYRRRIAERTPETKWLNGIAVLNDTILRLANGDEIGPKLRKVLFKALSSGQVQLIPQRPRQGNRSNPGRDRKVVGFIRGQIRKHPGRQKKAIYADAQKRFGLRRTQILEIWAKGNGPV